MSSALYAASASTPLDRPMVGMPFDVARNAGDVRRVFEAFLEWTLGGERAALLPGLDPADREAFLDYYAGLPAPGDAGAVRRFVRGMWNSDSGWVSRWIAERRRRPGETPVRVLDAGCGFGTFALLFAAVGAEVTAADLRGDRLRVAFRRQALFRERTGWNLPAWFDKTDVTRELWGQYDLVWLYNAISHVDPLEPFLDAAARHLRPGGVLVIGDINGANASRVRRLSTIRSDVHASYVDERGETHSYAVERTFTPSELRGQLEASGFRVLRHELMYGGASRVPALLACPLHGLFRIRAPLVTRWARRQFVVAGRRAA